MEREQEITAIPIHETFRVAALLAVVGGFLDAYTYILRGGVFANAQTGNIVLLGVHMADKDYRQALYYVVPIIAFSLGVFITEVLKKYFSSRGFAMYRGAAAFDHWIYSAVYAGRRGKCYDLFRVLPSSQQFQKDQKPSLCDYYVYREPAFRD